MPIDLRDSRSAGPSAAGASEATSAPLAAALCSPLHDTPRTKIPPAATMTAAAGGSTRWHGLTMIVALLAAIVFAAAESERSGIRRGVVAGLVVQAFFLTAGAWFFRRWKRAGHDFRIASPVLILIVALTLLAEPLGRWLWHWGRPAEIVVMSSMRNLMLGLAAVACWRQFAQLSGLLSLFLVLFAASLSATPAICALIVVYSVSAVGWLVASHWEGLRGSLIASQSSKPTRTWLVAALPVPIILLLTFAGLGQSRIMSLASGFFPSSGGNGAQDPFAEQGVGDGDALVAGSENIQSFGPIEDAPFRASDEPSLYDLYNENYDEPVIPTKTMERAVALPPDYSNSPETPLSQSQQAHREFSTLRARGAQRNRPVGDIASDALFYVAGRVPLHLRLEPYDLFDGINWIPDLANERQLPLRVEHRGNRPWIAAPDGTGLLDGICVYETHAVKVINLGGNRIPAPVNLRGVHIDLVEDPAMFHWSASGLVAMDRVNLPTLVAIHVASATVDPRGTDELFARAGGAERRYAILPEGPPITEIETLAREWGAGERRGWRQIQAVVSRLQQTCVLDRQYAEAPTSECPVADFLLRSHRGPDYQFATAAALMLRSLGYPTRVVSGFYVDPGKFDSSRGHTPVHRDDVHFWVEVYMAGGTWLTVEPTPGYEVLAPPRGFFERLLAATLTAGQFLLRYIVLCVFVFVAVVALWHRRVSLLDLWHTTWWRLTARNDARAIVLSTMQLFDRRLRWTKASRPATQIPAHWMLKRLSWQHDERVTLRLFFDLADWAAFAPSAACCPAGCGIQEVCDVCRRALDVCSVQRLEGPRRRPTPVWEQFFKRACFWRTPKESLTAS
ncbi:MAG: hypothetical protein JSS02_23910 [Planctomycetes bacterium]|nr:hypothetical protein [Planctomycetota bacterium]